MRRVLDLIAWMHARSAARPLFGTFGILRALDRVGAGHGTHKVTVCAGDRVRLDTRAASHDPAVFPGPGVAGGIARYLMARQGTTFTLTAPETPSRR